jgi:DNA-binding NtrC family response regulator
LIAASNSDLKKATEKKQFREDLFYRLSVFPITIPPLRDRREDIPELAEYFVKKYCVEMKKPKIRISREAMSLLDKYHWPGNVRELENTIERAIILCEGKKILPEHLREGAGLKEVGQHAQAEAERALIIRVLTQVRGNKRKASQALKIDYTTLFEKIKRYSIDA